MFTGIVSDIGRIVAVSQGRDARAFVVDSSYDPASIALGASIAHAGVCLTVVAVEPGSRGAHHTIEASAETLSKTTLGSWQEGGQVNLERALRAGDELGGHLVSGHVDGVGEVVAMDPENGSWRLVVRVPRPLAAFIAPKGSVALDGVSLTVNAVIDEPAGSTRFGVNIIPHTAQATTLGALAPGAPLNVEIDQIARYLARALEWRSAAGRQGSDHEHV